MCVISLYIHHHEVWMQSNRRKWIGANFNVEKFNRKMFAKPFALAVAMNEKGLAPVRLDFRRLPGPVFDQ